MALHGSVTVTRQLAATPSDVFAAFADPERRQRWFQMPGRTLYELDFRVGGGEVSRGTFAAMDTPEQIEVASRFLDIVPDERIVFSYELVLDGRRRTVSLVTVELAPVDGGTAISYTEQYALLVLTGDGSRDRAHIEGGLRLLLNGLMTVLAPATAPSTVPRR
jgi:uncharacterized protein YndB with AHSA1/START domain